MPVLQNRLCPCSRSCAQIIAACIPLGRLHITFTQPRQPSCPRIIVSFRGSSDSNQSHGLFGARAHAVRPSSAIPNSGRFSPSAVRHQAHCSSVVRGDDCNRLAALMTVR